MSCNYKVNVWKGIIDIDQMGIGDKLMYVALTNMALLNMEYDTDYVKCILKEMQYLRFVV